MQIYTTKASLRAALQTLRRTLPPDATIGLVPTMGALHDGHRSLIRIAGHQSNTVVVSLFVNPTQFSPAEDLDRYPRPFAEDCALLEREGVDILFAPSAEEMYPNGTGEAIVDVPEIGSRLDGQSRPGHFRGVATIVTRLFHLVTPDLAFFGQKDAAQVAVIRALVRDLDLPIKLVICPTIREPDLLALSSRNRYLTPTDREHALALPRALKAVCVEAQNPAVTVAALRQILLDHLQQAPGLRLEYTAIVHPDTLEPVPDLTRGALVAIAAHVGETRLIDNILLPPQ